MKKFNGIEIHHVQYHGINPVTPKQFHEAIETHFNQVLIPRHYQEIAQRIGNACELVYDYEAKKYKVNQFYYAGKKAKRA